jgi:hypothetical protein
MSRKGFGKPNRPATGQTASSGKDLSFPWYFSVNDQLVQVIGTDEGGMTVLLFNPDTGEFEHNTDYLAHCFDPGQAVQRLSEDEFQQQLAKLLII